MFTKALELKAVSATGDVEAVVATLGVKDKDGDVTEKGFFGTQDTKIVSGHDWSQILLGKGVVSDEDGKEAILSGALNLEDPAAAALHSKLVFDMDRKFGPPMIEWSYGFKILPGGSRSGKFGADDVQFLQPLPDGSPGGKIYEASPVLVGAGEGTRTLAVKQAGSELVSTLLELGLTPKNLTDLADRFGFPWEQDRLFDEPQKFIDQLGGTLDAVEKVLDRAKEIAEMREASTDGRKKFGDATLERLDELSGKLASAVGTLDALLRDGPDGDPDERTDLDGYALLQAQYESIRR